MLRTFASISNYLVSAYRRSLAFSLHWGHSISKQYKNFSFVTHHLRIRSLLVSMRYETSPNFSSILLLVHINISMRYENSPNFSSILLLVPELQHFEVGIFRGKHVLVAAIFTTPVHINLSLNFDRVAQLI